MKYKKPEMEIIDIDEGSVITDSLVVGGDGGIGGNDGDGDVIIDSDGNLTVE